MRSMSSECGVLCWVLESATEDSYRSTLGTRADSLW